MILGCKAGQIVKLFAHMAKKDRAAIIFGATHIPCMEQGDFDTMAVRVRAGPCGCMPLGLGSGQGGVAVHLDLDVDEDELLIKEYQLANLVVAQPGYSRKTDIRTGEFHEKALVVHNRQEIAERRPASVKFPK